MKQIALFLSNEIYFDETKKEGGVRLCTQEYRSLIQELFEVVDFPVRYHLNLWYRIKVKLAANAYNDYLPETYRTALKEVISKHKIKYVFINLSNAAVFAPVIKQLFGKEVKVIICSHGNESGDFLHEVTRHRHGVPFHQELLSSVTLGKMLKKEAILRQEYIDAVLTVSPVEEEIENWIGAKKVMMVPRTIKKEFLDLHPVPARFGFMGDLSHRPNFFGIDEVCKAIAGLSHDTIDIRLVGAPQSAGEQLAANYPFVTYLGYLDREELLHEVAGWSYFLNPVFYYSRGVSTKLAKAWSWGLPVITTTIGCRGYQWLNGNPVFANTAIEMAKAMINYSTTTAQINESAKQTQLIVESAPSIKKISGDLGHLLQSLS
ncbi:glycosyltransferase [Lacibacter sp. H375]|uniref:glycosyltransferase n=1 Tax=Lacibacter sp. H375 TaxID=3133424 RepID=UPI0030C63016